jgi:RNA polymerase sigma-B factor
MAVTTTSPNFSSARHRQRDLKREDLEALFARWRRDGDRRAHAEIVERYLPMARSLARRYVNSHIPYEDLVQVASLGLVSAVDRFDPRHGSAFASFAIPTILGELKRYFRNTGWVAHVPRRTQELTMRVEGAARRLAACQQRSPRVEEIAQYLELSTEDVITALTATEAHFSVSLDAPLGGGGEPAEPLGELLGQEDRRFAAVDTSVSLERALHGLPYLEREAMRLRLHEELRQSDIAKRLGCSQMHVSRLLRSAAAKLADLVEPG